MITESGVIYTRLGLQKEDKFVFYIQNFKLANVTFDFV